MTGLTEIIADILIRDDAARNSDAYLYHAVCEKIAPAAMSVPFGVMIQNLKQYGLPTYDTVTRLRRKIQRIIHLWSLDPVRRSRRGETQKRSTAGRGVLNDRRGLYKTT